MTFHPRFLSCCIAGQVPTVGERGSPEIAESRAPSQCEGWITTSMDNTIRQITKHSPVVAPQDSVQRAAGLMRASESSRIIVADGLRIVGTLGEADVASFVSSFDNVEAALQSPIAPLVQERFVTIESGATLRKAAEVLGADDFDVVPVVDPDGSFRGVVHRRDVVGRLTRTLRPSAVAGMATPLGVYLTTGTHSGGAGNAGLVLTGSMLMLMIATASLAVEMLDRWLSKAAGLKTSFFLSMPAFVPSLGMDFGLLFAAGLTALLLLMMLRFTPISGYHAAEHMTVHAIESGEPLTREVVRRMPRVHPRCGTNLLAAAGVFIIITNKVNSQLSVLLAMIVVMIGWRMVGGWLQYFVTTRSPSEKQIESGLAAGRELLDRYLGDPGRQYYGLRRVWRMGFIQTACGMAAAYWMLWLIQKVFHLPQLV